MGAQMSASAPRTFLMPDLEKAFAVARISDNGVNPFHDEARPDARAWINLYNASVYGPKMRIFMDNCNLELLNSFTYPYANRDGLRATMDLSNLLWVYDEFTDNETGDGAKEAAIIVWHALHDSPFEAGEKSWIYNMMADFKRLHISRFGPDVARRFIDHFCEYTKVVGREAELREKNQVLNIQDYIEFRRETSGIRGSFDLAEYGLGLNLPEVVFEDPAFMSGYNAAMDLVFWANDLYSYNMEQAKGHAGANVVTVIMKSRDLDIQSAVDFVGGFCECLVHQWQVARDCLAARPEPHWRDAARVLEAYGDWIRGNAEWSFTTERYFGQENSKIRKTRLVTLRVPFTDTVNLTE